MKNFEQELIITLNQWYDDLEPVEESDYVKYTFSKSKFKKMYLEKTGEFLKVSQRIETLYFNKIAEGLSKDHDFSEDLLNEYLEWCFTNYDYVIRKHKSFNLNSLANLSKEWDKDLFTFEPDVKNTLKDLNNITVSDNVFEYFETYGIPLVTTKLSLEKNIPRVKLEEVITSKLSSLTNKQEDLLRLKNMLRNTVENSPYSSEIIFKDYKIKLKEFFSYFTGEIWAL